MAVWVSGFQATLAEIDYAGQATGQEVGGNPDSGIVSGALSQPEEMLKNAMNYCKAGAGLGEVIL